jgi:general secretion pathway protein B
MSFILNALRKSEQERQALHAETVTDRIVINQLQPNKSKSVKFYAALIIGNVLLIFGVFVWLRYGPLTFLNTVPQATSSISLLPKVLLTPTIKSEKPIQAETPEKASIAEWVNNQKPLIKDLTTKPAIKKETTLEPVKSVDHLKKTTIPAENHPTIINENNQDTNSDTRKPENTKIPFLSDLPVEFRRTVPELNINVFVYSEHGEESFVMIDMLKYKSGQQLKNGMTLKAILNDSLLIAYQNREFQIERP